MPDIGERMTRPCPLGAHWVRTHQRRVIPSTLHPDGLTTVDGHCRRNPSSKEMILSDELKYIEEKYFGNTRNLPSRHPIGFGKKGSQFDALIGGWTQYWNERFPSREPLDPDYVKALIGTESSFNQKTLTRSKSGWAVGLMQVTEETLKILKNEKGELKDHLVKVTFNDLQDPSLNIAAGVRWLFRKKEITAARLGREPLWSEVIEDYKGVLRQKNEKKTMIMKKFNEFLSLLKLGRLS